MGEIADMILDGLLDEETGELIDGDAPGYPRSPTREARERRVMRAKKRSEIKCPQCGKLCSGDGGLRDHVRAKHPS